MDLRKTHTTVINHGDPEQKRAEILEYFHATFDIDEKLYDTLRYDDAFKLRADRLRHPLIFYFGHTATFYINKLMVAQTMTHASIHASKPCLPWGWTRCPGMT